VAVAALGAAVAAPRVVVVVVKADSMVEVLLFLSGKNILPNFGD